MGLGNGYKGATYSDGEVVCAFIHELTHLAIGTNDILDMDGYDALSFRLNGDGRKYIASLRVDDWIVGETSHDVWQAFLFARAHSQSVLQVYQLKQPSYLAMTSVVISLNNS